MVNANRPNTTEGRDLAGEIEAVRACMTRQKGTLAACRAKWLSAPHVWLLFKPAANLRPAVHQGGCFRQVLSNLRADNRALLCNFFAPKMQHKSFGKAEQGTTH